MRLGAASVATQVEPAKLPVAEQNAAMPETISTYSIITALRRGSCTASMLQSFPCCVHEARGENLVSYGVTGRVLLRWDPHARAEAKAADNFLAKSSSVAHEVPWNFISHPFAADFDEIFLSASRFWVQ